MRQMILHGPATRNDGAYLDAGARVSVGPGPTAIGVSRAASLVKQRLAARVTA